MRRKAIVARVLRGGEQPGEAYPSTARFVRLSRAASDADHTTLFRLVAHDQAARESLSRQAKQLFGPNLDPLASAILDGVIAREAVEADAASRAWLRAAVAHRGWFRIPSDGEDADLAAWLIVQHGDADRAFQEAMIRLLAPLAAAGETSALRFAFLYDRWAAGAGQPQRYGLQGRCVAAGVWRPLPIAEPDTLEARRRAAGFAETFDQFVAKERKACPAASPAGP
ncbi:MAG TPA: DUF6624 domain-containing protein [Caulobacteraceae bacterium]|nr:DUF6624 domain-containing protein [Caulobacteraceae bacterium]